MKFGLTQKLGLWLKYQANIFVGDQGVKKNQNLNPN